MLVGYMRVSTDGDRQVLDLQRDAQLQAGVDERHLFEDQSDVTVRRYHTDGGGASDLVFALCALLAYQFAPRIPDLKSRKLYCFDKPSTYPALEPLIAGRINIALIRAHWAEILRVAASVRTGTVTASLIMRQLASYPRQTVSRRRCGSSVGWSGRCSP